MLTFKKLQEIVDTLTEEDILVESLPGYYDYPQCFAYPDAIGVSRSCLKFSEDEMTLTLAHEVAHIELNHFISGTNDDYLQELEADKVAKLKLRELGWNEERIDCAFMNVMENMCPEKFWDDSPLVKTGHYPTWQETINWWKSV
jgi:hypothetical protein